MHYKNSSEKISVKIDNNKQDETKEIDIVLNNKKGKTSETLKIIKSKKQKTETSLTDDLQNLLNNI